MPPRTKNSLQRRRVEGTGSPRFSQLCPLGGSSPSPSSRVVVTPPRSRHRAPGSPLLGIYTLRHLKGRRAPRPTAARGLKWEEARENAGEMEKGQRQGRGREGGKRAAESGGPGPQTERGREEAPLRHRARGRACFGKGILGSRQGGPRGKLRLRGFSEEGRSGRVGSRPVGGWV